MPHVTPIFKKGNHQVILETSVLCKVLDIIKYKIMELLATNNLLSDEQLGFRAGCSCVTHLKFAICDG